MQVEMSKYLLEQKDFFKTLVSSLEKDFKYVSVLGTDTKGKRYSVQKTGISIDDSIWTERGFVVRVYNGINYSEFSFNNLFQNSLVSLVKEIKEKTEDDFRRLKSSSLKANSYSVLEEERIKDNFFGEVKILPERVSSGEKIAKLNDIMEKGLKLSDLLIDFRLAYEEVHVSKIFISSNKDLEQSYIWSQAYMVPIVRKGNNSKYYFESFSGLKGAEILAEMKEGYQETIQTAEKLLDAEKIQPGEYDVICDPDVAGLIAHEAFGHGVEMDMFVKERAKAVEYLNKPVASKLVTMHDGAAAAEHVSSYLFDDEGIIGKDTIIIENGILKTGISDMLSALQLETESTGNGKRESFERKAYARMTNTFFAPGNDTVEDMISSIEKGYLLEGVMSGMEDPKNWGIQCMLTIGREIKDGRLTGKIVSPIIMTGYVPDVLQSISMVSVDLKLSGSGACGKGYKEFVKVSSGGPYLKTKARLG